MENDEEENKPESTDNAEAKEESKNEAAEPEKKGKWEYNGMRLGLARSLDLFLCIKE